MINLSTFAQLAEFCNAAEAQSQGYVGPHRPGPDAFASGVIDSDLGDLDEGRTGDLDDDVVVAEWKHLHDLRNSGTVRGVETQVAGLTLHPCGLVSESEPHYLRLNESLLKTRKKEALWMEVLSQ